MPPKSLECTIQISCVALTNTGENIGYPLKWKTRYTLKIFDKAQSSVLKDWPVMIPTSTVMWLSIWMCYIWLVYDLIAFQLASRYYLQYVSHYLVECFDTLLWEWKIFGKRNCVLSFSSCSITISLYCYYCFSAPLTDKPPKLLYPVESKLTIQETQLGE